MCGTNKIQPTATATRGMDTAMSNRRGSGRDIIARFLPADDIYGSTASRKRLSFTTPSPPAKSRRAFAVKEGNPTRALDQPGHVVPVREKLLPPPG